MNEWIDELSDLTAAGEPVVIVTVAGIRGSAPREVGAKMLVTPTATVGTIGGGQLEYQCTHLACELLDAGATPVRRKFPLGASMGQCCGGVVEILFEPVGECLPGWLADLRALHGQREPAVVVTRLRRPSSKFVVTATGTFHEPPGGAPAAIVRQARESIDTLRTVYRRDDWFLETVVASDFHIAVFGAGHVGSAVVRALSALDCNIRWVDSRRNVFRETPANVRAIETGEPALEVAALPPGSFYLVMTHSHALDYEICTRILARGDAAYCGLIGSTAKRRRFEKRFRAQGIGDDALRGLTCPIGVSGITGKKPSEIAVAVTAEMLQVRERALGRRLQPVCDNVHPLRGRRR